MSDSPMPPDPTPSSDPNRIDMPFELRATEEEMDVSDGLESAGLVVLSAVSRYPDGTALPCLVYRFARPDGTGFYPPITLIMSAGDMAQLKVFTSQAANAAIRAARA